MSTVEVRARLSTDELLNAAVQLSPVELKHLIARLIAAQTRVSVLADDETALLQKINAPLPDAQKYRELAEKRDSETLSDVEYVELLAITERQEAFNVVRMQALADLARLRGQDLDEVMKSLEIQGPVYAG